MAIVYKHIRSDTNEVFYIGIGKKKNRMTSHSNRNNHWHNIVKKYGFIAEIIEDDLSWECACEREKYWIKYYGRKDLNEGNLVNLTDGGEGIVGNIVSHTVRQKMSENNGKYWKYNPVPIETLNKIKSTLIGRKMSDEVKKKISISKIGKKLGPMSDETQEKIRIKNTGKKRTLETIDKIKKAKTGRIVPEYVKDKIRGKNNPNYGKSRPDEVKEKISKSSLGKKMSISARNKMSISSMNKNLKPVIQYDLDGTFIKEWNSIKSAGSELKINRSHISNCCNGKRKTSGGYVWKLK